MNARIVLTHVQDHGWLPTIETNGREQYRGEFCDTPQEAFECAAYVLPQIQKAAA